MWDPNSWENKVHRNMKKIERSERLKAAYEDALVTWTQNMNQEPDEGDLYGITEIVLLFGTWRITVCKISTMVIFSMLIYGYLIQPLINN